MSIRAIGFDYLGVTAVLPNHDRTIFETIGEILAIEPANVREAYQAHNHGFQIGEYDLTELWQRVANDLNRPEALGAMLAATKLDVPIPDLRILELADRLRKNHYRVGLLSNLASGTEWDATLNEAGVADHFDAVILSGDIGIAKPDPRAFQALASALDVETNEMIFIDDREMSVAGVEDIGITPIIFRNGEHSMEDLITQLKTHGVRI